MSAYASATSRHLTSMIVALAGGLLLFEISMIWLGPQPSSGIAGAGQHSLTGFAETLTGPGHVRLAETTDPAGARHLTVLLDRARGHYAGDLRSLLEAAGGLDTDAGDQLDLKVIDFASPAPWIVTAPSAVRLGGLALLLLVAVSLYRRPNTSRVQADPATAVTGAPAETQRPTHPATPSRNIPAVTRLAADDPDSVAQTLNQWIGAEPSS